MCRPLYETPRDTASAPRLPQTQTFYFGNLIGDSGDGRGGFTVSATDFAGARAAVGTTDPALLNRFDANRDGKINVFDVLTVRNNQRHTLPPLTAPVAGAAAARGSSSPEIVIPTSPRTTARPARRGVLDLSA